MSGFISQIGDRARAEREAEEVMAAAEAPRINFQALQDAEHARRGGSAMESVMVTLTASTAAFMEAMQGFGRTLDRIARLMLLAHKPRIHRNTRRRPKRQRRSSHKRD